MGKVTEKIEENKTKGKEFKLLCSRCSNETKHLVLSSIDMKGSEEYDEHISIDWSDNYQILHCKGCETVSFRHLNWFSEYFDPHMGNDGTTERLYPKRDINSLNIKDFTNVPNALRRIYRESIEAYNNDGYILCAAGLRALVEGICANQSITDGPVEYVDANGVKKVKRKSNLEGKIFGLHEKGFLTKSNAEILHQHRYLGNDAVHELAQPSSRELKLAVEVIEHVFEQLYEMPEKALELKKKTAQRKSKK